MKNFIMMLVGIVSVVCGYMMSYIMLEDLNFTYLNDSFEAQVVTIIVLAILFDVFAALVLKSDENE